MSPAAREAFERQQREARERKALDPHTLTETEIHREWPDTGHGIYALFSQELTEDEIREFLEIFVIAARRRPKPAN